MLFCHSSLTMLFSFNSELNTPHIHVQFTPLQPFTSLPIVIVVIVVVIVVIVVIVVVAAVVIFINYDS